MRQVYEYKGKEYSILYKSKIKIWPSWVDIVIYQCEYSNPDGQIWCRLENDFFSKFKKVENKLL